MRPWRTSQRLAVVAMDLMVARVLIMAMVAMVAMVVMVVLHSSVCTSSQRVFVSSVWSKHVESCLFAEAMVVPGQGRGSPFKIIYRQPSRSPLLVFLGVPWLALVFLRCRLGFSLFCMPIYNFTRVDHPSSKIAHMRTPEKAAECGLADALHAADCRDELCSRALVYFSNNPVITKRIRYVQVGRGT